MRLPVHELAEQQAVIASILAFWLQNTHLDPEAMHTMMPRSIVEGLEYMA